MKNTDTKFDFLTTAISDTQETIRFIDSKAAFSTIIIGGMLALLFSDYEKICQNYCPAPWYVKILLWISLIGILGSVYCLIKVIMPVKKTYCKEITPRFYLGAPKSISTKLSPKKMEIHPPIEEYQKQINGANDEDLIKSLTCELYTVSFIREVKTQRLNNLLVFLAVSAVFFIAAFLFLK